MFVGIIHIHCCELVCFFSESKPGTDVFFTKLVSAEAEIISVYMTIFTKGPSTIHCLPATAA